MASFIRNKKVYISDTDFSTDTLLHVNCVVITANADSWECILKDKRGDIVVDAAEATKKTKVIPLNGQDIYGIKADTLTNIKSVIIYLENIS
jgi:hypothetical protein